MPDFLRAISPRTTVAVVAFAIVATVLLLPLGRDGTLGRHGFDARIAAVGWQPASDAYDSAVLMGRTHRDDEYIQFVAKTSYDMAGRDQLAMYVDSVRTTC